MIDISDNASDKFPNYTTKFGTFQIVWTDGVVNMCFLILYMSFQFNACEMFRQKEFVSFVNGLVLFSLAILMEFLLIIEPPQLLKWIPFWPNTLSRGIVLCFISVFSLNGDYIVGTMSLVTSVLVTIAPLLTGSFSASPSLLKYQAIFNPSNLMATSKYDDADVKDRLNEAPLRYQTIPEE